MARQQLGASAFATEGERGAAMPLADAVADAREVFVNTARDTPVGALESYGLTWLLRLFWQGKSDREIAELLFVTRATASRHVAANLSKLDVQSRAAAVARARDPGLGQAP